MTALGTDVTAALGAASGWMSACGVVKIQGGSGQIRGASWAFQTKYILEEKIKVLEHLFSVS